MEQQMDNDCFFGCCFFSSGVYKIGWELSRGMSGMPSEMLFRDLLGGQVPAFLGAFGCIISTSLDLIPLFLKVML